jgi:hypothetical protein
MVTVLQIIIYMSVFWLGCYLISRDLSSWRLRFAGLALVTFALTIAISVGYFPQSRSLANLGIILLFIPPIFWFATVVESLPEDRRAGYRGQMIFRLGVLIFVGVMIIVTQITDFPSRLFDDVVSGTQSPDTSPEISLQEIQFLVIFLGCIVLIGLTINLTVHGVLKNIPKTLKNLLGGITLFFTTGYLLLLINTTLFPIELLIIAISADLLMFGTVILVWDAMDAGESLLPDMLRSFIFSALTIIIMVGQVLLIMPDVTDTKLLLVFMLITTVIVVVTFDIPIQNGLDRVIFSRFPAIRQQRKDLRMAEAITIRRVEQPILTDEAEFIRYTRRAISSYGDLTKLATSPLTNLPIIQQRLAQRNAHDDTLERAKELKALLTESIMRLKPDEGDFGTSDEWRYYNALYFPYVAGLKPYSLRVFADDLDGTYRDALTWFRSQVPERTLYNWQNAAAMLIAQDLRERK